MSVVVDVPNSFEITSVIAIAIITDDQRDAALLISLALSLHVGENMQRLLHQDARLASRA